MKQELSKEKAEYTVNQVQYSVSSVFKPEEDKQSEDFADKMKRLILTEEIIPPQKKSNFAGLLIAVRSRIIWLCKMHLSDCREGGKNAVKQKQSRNHRLIAGRCVVQRNSVGTQAIRFVCRHTDTKRIRTIRNNGTLTLKPLILYAKSIAFVWKETA